MSGRIYFQAFIAGIFFTLGLVWKSMDVSTLLCIESVVLLWAFSTNVPSDVVTYQKILYRMVMGSILYITLYYVGVYISPASEHWFQVLLPLLYMSSPILAVFIIPISALYIMSIAYDIKHVITKISRK